jgi:hypothetical protein
MFEPGDLVAVPLRSGEHALVWVLAVEPSTGDGPSAAQRIHLCLSRRKVACAPDAEESDFDDPLLVHLVVPLGRLQTGNVVGRATDSPAEASETGAAGRTAVEAWRATSPGERVVVDAPLDAVFAALDFS